MCSTQILRRRRTFPSNLETRNTDLPSWGSPCTGEAVGPRGSLDSLLLLELELPQVLMEPADSERVKLLLLD